ncbi:hypothetical protein B0G71_2997 [Paraburkholderia sp. BL27I4N3]|uniref:hypothetical protein n=1 Tax=Paraburkholderia sp. BL27I4N3 TaxID=1938805 RepID=UPI000E25AD38|nr:hypothetical protein [Paraburkholderia sp. BL27I4N3]REE19880.1 hypothetical protein B0G71_2997 [Paraburkholderia sp. BL27I4N3]
MFSFSLGNSRKSYLLYVKPLEDATSAGRSVQMTHRLSIAQSTKPLSPAANKVRAFVDHMVEDFADNDDLVDAPPRERQKTERQRKIHAKELVADLG